MHESLVACTDQDQLCATPFGVVQDGFRGAAVEELETGNSDSAALQLASPIGEALSCFTFHEVRRWPRLPVDVMDVNQLYDCCVGFGEKLDLRKRATGRIAKVGRK
jgi:hypothetical protein